MKAILPLPIHMSLRISADPAPAQQASNERSDDELRAAYLQGARDAMNREADSRYGEHYMDSRERRRQQPQEERKSDKQL